MEAVKEEFSSQERFWLNLTKKSSTKNIYFFKEDRAFLSLNKELGKKLQTAIIVSNFLDKP